MLRLSVAMAIGIAFVSFQTQTLIVLTTSTLGFLRLSRLPLNLYHEFVTSKHTRKHGLIFLTKNPSKVNV